LVGDIDLVLVMLIGFVGDIGLVVS